MSSMAIPKIELDKVEFISPKIFKYDEKLRFAVSLKMKNINESIRCFIYYFGDPTAAGNDQLLAEIDLVPRNEEISTYEVEANCIDLTKIPISKLFGLTTILLLFKFRDSEFLRIGYIVDVSYEGINNEILCCNEEDEESIEVEEDLEDDEDHEEDLEDDEDHEEDDDLEDVEDHEEGEDQMESEDQEEGDDQMEGEDQDDGEDQMEGDDQEDDDDQVEGEDQEDDQNDDDSDQEDDDDLEDQEDDDDLEDQEDDDDLEDQEEGEDLEEDESFNVEETLPRELTEKAKLTLLDLIGSKKPKPTVLETPITSDKDNFVFKDIEMTKEKIIFNVYEDPMLQSKEIVMEEEPEVQLE